MIYFLLLFFFFGGGGGGGGGGAGGGGGLVTVAVLSLLFFIFFISIDRYVYTYIVTEPILLSDFALHSCMAGSKKSRFVLSASPWEKLVAVCQYMKKDFECA